MIDKVFSILKKDKRIWDEESQVLNRNFLLKLIEDTDKEIVQLLFEREDTKNMFFLKLEDSYIFKVKDFKLFIENNKIFNSYTSYSNRIGLSTGENHLIDMDKVVINFPFKDCILEGGQRKEDTEDYYYEYDESLTQTQKNLGYEEKMYNKKNTNRSEVFYNEILAKKEIDRLLDEKAFVNWKEYTQAGENKVEEICKKDNLIIKGNNLLALSSLKNRFKNSIKSIYIDPPYYFKTQQNLDSFGYNTNFKLSTWLVFMKNRIQEALELLNDEGIIFVQTNSDGHHYLKVMLDELIGVDNFMSCITVSVKAPSGVAAGAQMIFDSNEYILVYAKDNTRVKYNNIKVNVEVIDEKSKTSESYKYLLNKYNDENLKLKKEIDGIKIYEVPAQDFEVVTMEDRSERSYYDNFEKIFRTASLSGGQEKKIKKYLDTVEGSLNKMYVYEYIPTRGRNKGKLTRNLIYKKEGFLYLSDYAEKNESEKVAYKQEHITNMFNENWWQGISKEGNITMKNAKKPEILLKHLIEMSTDEGDYVMDFFLGSGTTAAVAHKMNRNYIGIEQLNYGEESAVERLKNVINGDTTGISKDKDIDWQGGGSFIYCELAEWNEKAKELILETKSIEELKELFEVLTDKYFLDYNLNVNNFINKTINEKEFIDLTLEEQKEIFLNMLDLNQLYINQTEMKDKKFGLSEEDISLTEEFYKGGE